MTLPEMMTLRENVITAKQRLESEAAQLDAEINALEAKKREAIARGDFIGKVNYEAADKDLRTLKARRDYVREVLKLKHRTTTRADVLKEWEAYATNYNAIIGNRLADYEKACKALAEQFKEICELQAEALKVRSKLTHVLDAIAGGRYRIMGNQADPEMMPIKAVSDGIRHYVYLQGSERCPDVAFFATHGLISDDMVSKYDAVTAGYPANLY